MRDAYTEMITQKFRLNLMAIRIGECKETVTVKLTEENRRYYPLKTLTINKKKG